MKSSFLSICLLLSASAFSSEVYHCNTSGPDYLLTFHDDQSITLDNSIKKFICLRGYENFPGTELDLNVLNCARHLERVKYYITQYSDTEIILSKNFISSQNISCLKQ